MLWVTLRVTLNDVERIRNGSHYGGIGMVFDAIASQHVMYNRTHYQLCLISVSLVSHCLIVSL